MEIHVKKTIPVTYKMVVDAYGKVRRGGKASGVDGETWEEFNRQVEKNLYVIWNRLSSGSYFPQAVRGVAIPKKDGNKRKLGIPTLRDRIAQQVVKEYLEKAIDHKFHKNSYGYRPLKSAKQAVKQVQENCYRYDFVIDMDISKFFDEIDHELMLKAVGHIMPEKWVHMYVERWLKAPVEQPDGTRQLKAGKGTPQGGVISPILANLYLHYSFDLWLSKNYPQVNFVRYADDIVVHCSTEQEAQSVLEAIKQRLGEVKLRVEESKTKIAYCKDYRRKGQHEHVKFDFLGFSFKPVRKQNRYTGGIFVGHGHDISEANQKKMTAEIRTEALLRTTQVELQEIAAKLNQKLRGWINYYSGDRQTKSRELYRIMCQLEVRLLKWISKKHKTGYRKAWRKMKEIKQNTPHMFYHWQAGYTSLSKATRAV